MFRLLLTTARSHWRGVLALAACVGNPSRRHKANRLVPRAVIWNILGSALDSA